VVVPEKQGLKLDQKGRQDKQSDGLIGGSKKQGLNRSRFMMVSALWSLSGGSRKQGLKPGVNWMCRRKR
jgi:hypothetical protein